MVLEFTLVILIGVVGGIAARYLKQPTIVGYLGAGFFASLVFPHLIRQEHVLDAISQIGVALLLFALGIELNLKRFSRLITIAVLGGILQISISIGLYFFILTVFGVTGHAAFLAAAGFSLSSTAVVIKILNDKKMLSTLQGEIMVAWLLIQDLTVVPLLIVLPLVQEGIGLRTLPHILLPLAAVVYLIILALWFGRPISSYLFKKIARFNSPELLLLGAVSLCLLMALSTASLGLSFALGAFLAGVMLSEALEHYAVFSEVRPLRDLFSVVFFVTLPLLVPSEAMIPIIPFALLLSVFVIAVKFLVVGSITWFFGYHSKISFMVGIGLIQVGEFTFILVREGLRLGMVSEDVYALVLAVTIITILATPLLFGQAVSWYEIIRKAFKLHAPRVYSFVFTRGETGISRTQLPFKNHVVIIGHGRMGKYIARALEASDIPFVVIELDRTIVEELKKQGTPVVYGDPSDRDILDFAQADFARAVVIAIPDLASQLAVIVNTRRLNPNATIISRTQYERDQKLLKGTGADRVIHPEFAASLVAVQHVLHLFHTEKETVQKTVARLKLEHGIA